MCAASPGGHFMSGKGKAKGSSNKMDTSAKDGRNAADTFAGMPAVSGLGSYAPNGSASAPMTPVPQRGMVSETDEFLAVSMGGTGQAQQPRLENAAAPVGGPVNPLVAAQIASNPSASGTNADLYPISNIEAKQGVKSFDTTFSGSGGSKKFGIVVALVVLLIAGAFVGAFAFLNNQEAQGARASLDNAIESLYSTDAVFASLDQAISQGDLDVSAALEKNTTTMNALSAAEKAASEAARSSDKLSVEEQSALSAVVDSISARRSMLEAARMIQNVDPLAVQGFDVLQQVYAYILDADTNYQASDDLWNAQNSDNPGYESMLAYLVSAYNDLQSAQALIETARQSGSEVDYTALSECIAVYANLCSACYERGVAASNGDWASAQEKQVLAENYAVEYNVLRAALPATPEEYASANHSSAAVKTYVSNYGYAREKCVTADAVVSGYVGQQVGVTGSLPKELPVAEQAPDQPEAVADPAAQSVDQTVDQTADQTVDQSADQTGEPQEA